MNKHKTWSDMNQDPIIHEAFDPFTGYTWKRSSGEETTVSQEQGLDLVVTQRLNDLSRSVWHYSEPGHYLFSALLAYQRGLGQLSTLTDIQHVLGETGDRNGTINPDLGRMAELALGMIPTCEETRVVLADTSSFFEIGAYMSGKLYFAFQEWDNCIIASSHKEGNVEIGVMRDGLFTNMYLTDWRRELVLDDEDVKRVLKGIYFYAPDKDVLDFVHKQVQMVK